MKPLFYKNKLDIGVTRVLFKQVTSYSRNPLTDTSSLWAVSSVPRKTPDSVS